MESKFELEALFDAVIVEPLEEEETMTPEQLAIKNVGKQVRSNMFGVIIIWSVFQLYNC